VALQLKKAGIRKVRPLAGGFEAWRKLELPIEPYNAGAQAELISQPEQ
jgi:rhodanese-related sulfurtransferase